MRVLWEKNPVANPAAHQALRKKRWLIALGVAALSALSVVSLGAWGLVYPAALLVLAAFAIEPMHWLRKRLPVQRVWTNGDVLGVEGAAEVRAHPREPILLASIAAFTVYPVLGGAIGGASSGRARYTAIDLWLADGRRRLWIFDRITGIEPGDEAALARVLSKHLHGRWRQAPADADMPAEVGKIERKRLAQWV